MAGMREFTCDECESVTDIDYITELLDTGASDPIDLVDKNCAYCSTMHEVIEHHDYFVCMNCFSVDADCPICGWCNEGK